MSDKKFKDPTFTISKVYTKTGDSGKTSLVGGQKVLKSNIRINAFGKRFYEPATRRNVYFGLQIGI